MKLMHAWRDQVEGTAQLNYSLEEYEIPSSFHEASDSLALYVNIPFCDKACSFCHYLPNLQFKHHSVPQDYMLLLIGQLRATLQALPASSRFDSIYFGGGTPSLLSDDQIEAIFDLIGPWLGRQPECCIEAHPSSWRPSLSSLGIFNRISLGIQTFDRLQLQRWSRLEYGYSDVTRIMENIRDASKKVRLNLDLLFENCVNEEDIVRVRELMPESITLYPRTGTRRVGDLAKIYSEIRKAGLLLPEHTPLSDMSFIFLRDPADISYYARHEHEYLGDVVGVGNWAVSLVGSNTFVSRLDRQGFRFNLRSAGDRALRTFLRSVLHGVPDTLWQQVEPHAGQFLKVAGRGLSHLVPAKAAGFDAFLVSRGYQASHLKEFRRSALFGAEDPLLLHDLAEI